MVIFSCFKFIITIDFMDTSNSESNITSNSVNSQDENSVSPGNGGLVSSTNIIKKGNIQIEVISPGIYRATSEKSRYIIEYDRNKCIGAASCAAIAPLTFYMDDENKAMLKEDSPDFDEDDIILAAAQSCPVFAIKIIDKETNEVLFPLE